MNIDNLVTSIVEEANQRRRVPSPTERAKFRHRDVSFKVPSWRRVLRAIKNFRNNPNELLHFIFHLPVVGYLLNLVSYGLRLPTQLRKIREDIASLHQHLADLETRMSKMTAAEVSHINQRILELESTISKSDLAGRGPR